jgi:hypothetical protein
MLETVCSVSRLVRGAKTQEIERYDTAPTGHQMRDQIIPDMQVIRETVHENKGRPDACVIAGVDPSFLARDVGLDERHRIRGHALSFSFG